jgi:hypothetical protein
MASPAPRGVYYPLRGNAHSLLAGAPFHQFRRRLKVAALVHEKLLLDSGSWQGSSGPRGANEVRFARHVHPTARLQTARERAKAQGGNFYVAIKPTDSPSPPRVVIHSPATISWRATFEPIREELPRAFAWLDFVEIELIPAWKRAADDMARAEERDPFLMARYPDEFTRGLVAKGASHGLLTGVAMGMAVSLDKLHAQVFAARLARGEAELVLGADALVAVLPDVRDMSWDQVDWARGLPGLPRLRAVLADVEQAGREASGGGGSFDAATVRAFQAEYSKAMQEAEEGWGSVWTSVGLGVAVSIATSQLGAAESLVAGSVVAATVEAGQHLFREHRRRNTWMVAADDLRAIAARSRKVRRR